MRPCLKRIQPMPNVPLAYVSVFQRMSDIFYTLACASTIRNSVTGPLDFIIIEVLINGLLKIINILVLSFQRLPRSIYILFPTST
jgi:hypothetical protein